MASTALSTKISAPSLGCPAGLGRPLPAVVVDRPTADACSRPALNLLEAYKTWLEFEQRWLCWEMAGDPFVQQRYRGAYRILCNSGRADLSKVIRGAHLFVGEADGYHVGDRQKPSARAALVLSTVGCEWRETA